ncbi:Pyrrolidone-carboxylate peptidase [compost metagenome]
MHILVTGFEPFGNDEFNASQEAVSSLPRQLGEHQVLTAMLPVSFAASGKALESLLAKHQPDALICVGEAGGRNAITPERWAFNEDDARIPDNDGAQPRSAAIKAIAPGRLDATLDPAAAVRALLAAGYEARVSEDAGRFVCNHIAYLAYSQPVPALFIHVPALRPPGVQATVGAETDASASQPRPGDLSQLSSALGIAILGSLAPGG